VVLARGSTSGAAYYTPPSEDLARPGRTWWPLGGRGDQDRFATWSELSTVFHEGVPGHHLQAGAAKMAGDRLSRFAKSSFVSGHGEGWALYAEQLGKEVGFYQDPVSDYGRLSSELFRAVRLVVDTGLHSEDWTRDQVVAFFRQSGAVDEPTIQAETDRYISWPAQALSYKLGQLKFRELRDRAQKALGPKFDIRTFHDEMLSGGVLPLDLLDSRTNSWIQQQKRGVKAAAAN